MKRMLTAIAVSVLGCVALAAPAGAALTAVSPGTDANGYPLWYQDATGQQLQLCGGAAQCPVVGNPFEDFYWIADAVFPSAQVQTARFAVEAADAGAGVQSTFGRFRLRVSGLVSGATYTVTHPFGVQQVVATGGTINLTENVGCAVPPGPCDFTAALPTTIGPFLRWDPAVAPAAPAGFVGDYAVAHKIVGSPAGTNFMRIQGPGLDVTTDQFLIGGRVNGAVTPMGSVSPRTSAFPTRELGQSVSQDITVRNESTVAMPVTTASIGGANSADFAITANTCASVPPAGTCTITVGFTPSAAGTRSATLTVGMPAGSPNTAALTGTGATAPVVESPAQPPIATPAASKIDVAALKVSALSVPRRVKVRTARSRGISVSFTQPVNATYVNVALYRLRGTRRTLVTRKRASAVAGLQRTVLRKPNLVRGNYVVAVRAGVGPTQLGPERTARVTLTR